MNVKYTCIILLGVLCIGCSPKSPSERLIGSWSLDVSCTLKADQEITNVSKTMRTRIENFVRPYIRHIIFEFDEDGIYRIRRHQSSDNDQVYDRYYYRILEATEDGQLTIESSANADFKSTDQLNAQFDGSMLRTRIGARMYCLKPY